MGEVLVQALFIVAENGEGGRGEVYQLGEEWGGGRPGVGVDQWGWADERLFRTTEIVTSYYLSCKMWKNISSERSLTR